LAILKKNMEQLNQTPTQEKELSLEEKERMEDLINNWVNLEVFEIEQKTADIEPAIMSKETGYLTEEDKKEIENKIRPEIERIHNHRFSSEEIIEMVDKKDFFRSDISDNAYIYGSDEKDMLEKEDIYEYLRKKSRELKELTKESGDNASSQIKKVRDQIILMQENASMYCKDCKIRSNRFTKGARVVNDIKG